VSNAIKFTERGGRVTMRMRVSGNGDDAAVCVSVVDTGMGLTPSEVHTLNHGEPFTQVGQGQLQGRGGTGLGLVITRHILELHNGSTLALSSAGSGHGTTCAMELKLRKASPEEVARAHKEAARLQAEECQGPLTFPPTFRILHVEDDRMLRKSFEVRVFRKCNVPFEAAVNGEEALRLILDEGKQYDLVLMDNQMPALTGEQTARRLRAAGYTGVIIGITGDPVGSPERANFASAGLNACVDKDTHGTKYVMRVIASYSNEHSSGPDARFTDDPSSSVL